MVSLAIIALKLVLSKLQRQVRKRSCPHSWDGRPSLHPLELSRGRAQCQRHLPSGSLAWFHVNASHLGAAYGVYVLRHGRTNRPGGALFDDAQIAQRWNGLVWPKL